MSYGLLLLRVFVGVPKPEAHVAGRVAILRLLTA